MRIFVAVLGDGASNDSGVIENVDFSAFGRYIGQCCNICQSVTKLSRIRVSVRVVVSWPRPPRYFLISRSANKLYWLTVTQSTCAESFVTLQAPWLTGLDQHLPFFRCHWSRFSTTCNLFRFELIDYQLLLTLLPRDALYLPVRPSVRLSVWL